MKVSRTVMYLAIVGAQVTFGQAGPPVPNPSLPAVKVMLAAVTRDESMLSGGIASSKWTGQGTVVVEPLAYITESGEWLELPCVSGTGKNCVEFEHDYLSKPHFYTVVSPHGRGATVHAQPTTLSDCFDYSGTGTYSHGVIGTTAIAASSTDMFADAKWSRRLSKRDASAIGALLNPKMLDSTKYLQVFSIALDGRNFYVVQRTFTDILQGNNLADFDHSDVDRMSLIFGIGVMELHHFHVLHWKQNTEDEQEQVLGIIRLKTGPGFLVTVVSDPESHSYRVYGVRNGRLTLIYSGGGSSC